RGRAHARRAADRADPDAARRRLRHPRRRRRAARARLPDIGAYRRGLARGRGHARPHPPRADGAGGDRSDRHPARRRHHDRVRGLGADRGRRRDRPAARRRREGRDPGGVGADAAQRRGRGGRRGAVLAFRIPIRDWVSGAVSYLQTALGPLFDGFADAVDALIGGLLTALQWAPVPVVIVAFAALAALLAGWRVGLFALAGLFVVENVGLWQPFTQTLALVLAAQVLIVLVGVPLGILAARSDGVERVIRPVLDF